MAKEFQGEDDVICVHGGQVIKYPVTKLAKEAIVDTNGAGDAFVGGEQLNRRDSHHFRRLLRPVRARRADLRVPALRRLDGHGHHQAVGRVDAGVSVRLQVIQL